ncbi:MAG: DUF4118 domain-containing protein [Acidimicrobiia bacterium]
MRKGRLRVFLGAAPGVGKTFAMLEEGHRLQDEGRRVVVGAVDAHGRAEIEKLAASLNELGLEPGDSSLGHSAIDLPAILAMNVEVALVDDLARANDPGSHLPTRWSEVESLLDAGVDVLTTLNIQNLESLNDVVYEITGVREKATIPDRLVRDNAEVELVDLTQERLLERLSAGEIYPAEKIDAATANYFRPGNLAALRELALSWTADRVDEDLADYRFIHGIDEPWETKERIIVGLSGAPGSDVVVRRAARTALRSRAELLGVHVRGSRDADDTSELEDQRKFVHDMGGTYHELVGDDVAESLLAFARAENATQIVLGTSRRSRIADRLGTSPAMQVIKKSGTIDVHVISYGAGPRFKSSAAHRGGIGSKRRLLAWLLTVLSLPVVTLLLLSFRGDVALENVLLVYLLTAVTIGVVGGAPPAVTAAGAGFLLANWFFTPPFYTWKIADAGHLFSLFAFLLVASAVGVLVGNATKKSADARRARAHAEALAAATTVTGLVSGTQTSGLTKRIRDVFAMSAAAVLRRSGDGWETVAAVGIVELASPDEADEVIPLTTDTVLVMSGGELTGDDRRVLRAFASQMAQALEREKLEKEAAEVEAMTETDRLRTALLNAVSHDLRTPLATIKASVTSLLEIGIPWSENQTHAFHQVILDETEHLNRMVGRLLDASRVRVGAVHVFFVPVGLDEVVASALSGLRVGADVVRVEIPDTLPPVQTDPALLERVVANLIENALSWSPEGDVVRVSAGEVSGRIDLRIVDRGPGIPVEAREAIHLPFQRFGDSTNSGGVGLGMAVAHGFLEAMGNQLVIEDTPGGGTTMVIGFKPAPGDRATSSPTARASRG